MRGGHNAKPTSEKLALGTYKPSRDAAKLENHIKLAAKIPSPPSGFDKRMSEKWYAVCKELFDFGILATADTDSIILYVQNWKVMDDSWKDIQKNGVTLWRVTKEGRFPITNPAYLAYKKSEHTAMQLIAQFGFSPKSRQQIKTNPQAAKKDILEDLDFEEAETTN